MGISIVATLESQIGVTEEQRAWSDRVPAVVRCRRRRSRGGGAGTARVARKLNMVHRRPGLDTVGLHILRRTCSHLAMRGAVPAAIQALTGHQSLVMMQT